MSKILEVKNLTAKYGNRFILNGYSFDLQEGEFVCLVGPNGCGKSTLLKTLLGIKGTDLSVSGTVLCKQVDVLRCSKRKTVARNISYLSQNETFAWNLKARDVVLQGRYCYSGNIFAYTKEDYAECEKAFAFLEIDDLKERNIAGLSGGEFQKVRIARCIAQNSSCILLDEPLGCLDFGYETDLITKLKEYCRKEKAGIIMSVHNLNLAFRFADKILTVDKNGSCIMGTVEEIMDTDILDEVYKVKFKKYYNPEVKAMQLYV